MIKFTISYSLSLWDNQEFIMVLEHMILSSYSVFALIRFKKIKSLMCWDPFIKGKFEPTLEGKC